MEKLLLLSILISLTLYTISHTSAHAETTELSFKKDYLNRLVDTVPGILNNQDPQTGRFRKGLWIVHDQHSIYPLAAVWSTASPDNPYYHDPKVLEAIMIGGDALIDDQDENGQWEFRKKDGSTWGKIHMPWTYSRWIRSYQLIKDAMPAERKKRWEDALTLGYSGISKNDLNFVHNVPCHHAMGLYIAGKALNRPEWCDQAQEFMKKVVEKQNPGGFWSEHHGPVVVYNGVYVDSLGVYYSVSKDKSVLPALERVASFQASFTYPDGSAVETVDERNPFHKGMTFGTVGLTHSAAGRGFIAHAFELAGPDTRHDLDSMTTFLLYGQEGSTVPPTASEKDRTFMLEGSKALIRRKAPWFVCLSAYCCPVMNNRWLQDRQNLVSIFHDKCGLILGGGNTKLQPLWSNFTVGDVSLLKHKAGDTEPDFTPQIDLVHVPSTASLMASDPPGLKMTYGQEECSIEIEPVDDKHLKIHLKASVVSDKPVAAHLTLMPNIGKFVMTEKMPKRKLGSEPLSFTSTEAGGWIGHAGWKLSLPEGAKVTWPVLPHNPYVKDGAAKPEEGRIVVSVPFTKEVREQVVMLSID